MLGVIAVHFNPIGYARPRANLHRFMQQMKGLPVWYGELSFDGSFQIPDGPNVLHLTGNVSNCLWQKERLINLVAEKLPSEIKSIAWIDADLTFGNDNWYFDTINALKEFPIVQLFQKAYWMNAHGVITQDLFSAGALPVNNKGFPHPGFAWAMRRELWDQTNGLFDASIIGSGDAWMCGLLNRHPYSGTVNGQEIESLKRKFDQWSARLCGDVPKLGYVRGGVFHHYHGSNSGRQYTTRNNLLKGNDFDFDRDVFQNDSGLWEWRFPGSPVALAMRQYFQSRDEDK